jgi:tetratricopeptide (TPR) repeat protein
LRGQTIPEFQPVIYQYLKKFQDDPSSRVFAPLTEAYRKAGLVDEAIRIAREGLQFHPQFMGGRVALARALFDKKSYQEVINELAPIVKDFPDNLIAQRLLAESYLFLGHLVEALDSFKLLLFFAPGDTDVAKMVQELEVQAYQAGSVVLRSDRTKKRLSRIDKIETLQGLLQKVERYRVLNELAG